MGAIKNLKRTAALLATAASLLAFGPSAASAAEGDAGHVNFDLNATSQFDSLLNAPADQQSWMHNTYYRVRGYAPWFNQAVSWQAPADFYKDLYAIYRDSSDDQQMVADHPDWVLHDASGKKLYIPCDCNNGSCTQFAGDIGNPAFRQNWIDQAKQTLAQGYKGIFIDDVNMSMTVSDGNGNPVRPLDPRTGKPMTDTDWERYMAEFVEEIRAQLPNAEIVHNVPWFNSESDPYVQREVKAANTIELERGFNDPGITGGNGTYGYDTFLKHIDWIHSMGDNFILEPYLQNAAQTQYEVANYLLTSNGGDQISSSRNAAPGDFAKIWQTDLGPALGSRYIWHGLERRDFQGGTVLVNPPDSANAVVNLSAASLDSKESASSKGSTGYRRLHRAARHGKRLHLAASHGVILKS